MEFKVTGSNPVLATNQVTMKYTEQIKLELKRICEETGEPAPKTVPGAGLLIMKWRGKARARELFTGAAQETSADIFKSSAYEAALETVIK